jgi:hypothetical protein
METKRWQKNDPCSMLHPALNLLAWFRVATFFLGTEPDLERDFQIGV